MQNSGIGIEIKFKAKIIEIKGNRLNGNMWKNTCYTRNGKCHISIVTQAIGRFFKSDIMMKVTVFDLKVLFIQ